MPRSIILLLGLAACAGAEPAKGGPGGGVGTDSGTPTADGPLAGAAADLATTAIPDQDPDPYSDDNVEMFGDEAISTDRLLIGVTPDATIGEINAALIDIDATILGGAPLAGLKVVQVPPGTAAAAEETAGAAPGVAAAMADFSQDGERLGKAHDSGDRSDALGCATDQARWRWDDGSIGRVQDGQWDASPWRDANWGLKFARVPLAWNLRDHMSRVGRPPAMAIVDQGFHSHADLPGMAADGNSGTHGLAVTSVALAGHTDGQGIEGVFPRGGGLASDLETRSLSEATGLFSWASRRVIHSMRLIGQGSHIVNASQGYSSAYRDAPEHADVFKGRVLKESAAWAAATAVLGHHGVTEFLVTCSAGNAGPWYPAQWNSGCGHRAAAGDSHFLAVEALAAPGNALASLSGSGGTLSAPGACVGVATTGSTTAWESESGTSYAAPFVAGAAAMIWAADPDLTHDLVRAALIESAHPAVTDVAPRVDAFAALLYIDTLRGDRAIQTALADIDDGTPDGNLRLAPDLSDLSATGPADDLRGDGCVDIKDLRVLRDAILASQPGGTDALDGPDDHVNRDLNGDGEVLPGDAADHPDDADGERVWARGDLNGDLMVDEADVAVMAEVWGAVDPDRCPVADTMGIRAGELTRWVQSSDVWVQIPTGREPLVRVEGATPAQAQTDDLHGPWHLTTSLLACDGEREIDACLHDDVLGVSCETRTARPGSDEHADALAAVESTEGLVFLSRDHDQYTAPVRVFAGSGGDWGDGVALPDSEDLGWSAGLAFTLSRDGHDLILAGCPGESLEDQRASSCLSRVDVRSGGQTAVTPEAGLSDWRLLDRDDGGRLLFGARDGVDERWFVIQDDAWRFAEAEIISDPWSAYGPRLHTPGAVINAGGFDGDTDSNGIHRSTTHPVVAWDEDAEATVCLEYGDRQVTDVFRAFVPNGPVVSTDGLVLTRPYGTTTPGTAVSDLSGDRTLELDGMTADHGAWSPAGRAVAFGTWNEGTVVAMLGDGDTWHDASLAAIDAIPLIAGTLRWSPDGTRLMIVDDAALSWGEADVWVYDAATGDLDVLPEPHEVAAGTPAWSPDSGSIATVSWFTDTLTCGGSSVDARHLDIVTTSLTSGVATRETSSFVDTNAGWPECGPVYPTDEYGPHWR